MRLSGRKKKFDIYQVSQNKRNRDLAYKGRKEVRNLQVNVGGGKDVRDYEEEKSEKTK